VAGPERNVGDPGAAIGHARSRRPATKNVGGIVATLPDVSRALGGRVDASARLRPGKTARQRQYYLFLRRGGAAPNREARPSALAPTREPSTGLFAAWNAHVGPRGVASANGAILPLDDGRTPPRRLAQRLPFQKHAGGASSTFSPELTGGRVRGPLAFTESFVR
jgi:hypothetical protein